MNTSLTEMSNPQEFLIFAVDSQSNYRTVSSSKCSVRGIRGELSPTWLEKRKRSWLIWWFGIPIGVRSFGENPRAKSHGPFGPLWTILHYCGKSVVNSI